MQQTKIILYLCIILLGFIFNFISCIKLNTKLNKEYFFYSYIIFIISFFFGCKLFHIILNFDFTYNITILFTGYSFLGGLILSIISLQLFSKVVKHNLLKIYLPSLILLYSILKISCFIIGCCKGINNIPIQLIESLINIIIYFIIIYKFKNKLVSYSLILFSITRLIVSFIRIYPNIFSFIISQIICIVLIIYGIKYKNTIDQ